MIETPADYRSFVFSVLKQNPVGSRLALGFPEFCFFSLETKSGRFAPCARVSWVLFFINVSFVNLKLFGRCLRPGFRLYLSAALQGYRLNP